MHNYFHKTYFCDWRNPQFVLVSHIEAICERRPAQVFVFQGHNIGQNYASHITFFSVFLANIEVSHPDATKLLKLWVIIVSRSFCPCNRTSVDKTMEEKLCNMQSLK